jgi:hypothetical protein
VHQVDGFTQQVIGAFELAIPVSKAEIILDEEVRNLSVMKHIGTTIPPGNRWYSIFQRYLHGLSVKVDALGGDSGSVFPNPDGSGTPYGPPVERPRQKPCAEAWAASLILAVAFVLLGVLGLTWAGALVVAVAFVLLALVLGSWSRKCCGRILCAVIDHLLLGSSAALGVLGLLLVGGVVLPSLLPAAAIAAATTAMLAASSFVARCRGGCCDEPERPCESPHESRPPRAKRPTTRAGMVGHTDDRPRLETTDQRR